MGAGLSASEAVNVQTEKQRVLQQLTNECSIGNVQVVSGVDINITNSNIPGTVGISQTQDIDATCVVKNSSTALAKALQSATTTAQAKNAAAFLKINVDVAKTMSFQNLENDIEQRILNTCNIQNVQDIHNIKVGITNSNVGNNLITQDMSNQANCLMNTVLDATTTAQQQSTASTTTGGADLRSMLIIGAIILAVLVIGGIVLAVVMSKKKKDSKGTSTPTTPSSDMLQGINMNMLAKMK